jgi:hypothetical protein
VPTRAGDLLERIDTAWQPFWEIAAAPDDVSKDAAGWTAKDHVAHVAAWERMLVAHLADGSDHEIAGMTPEAYAAASLEEINSRLHERWSNVATPTIARESASAHAALIACLAGLSDERLASPYWPDETPPRSVEEKVAGDSYLHYAEHMTWITELLKAASRR